MVRWRTRYVARAEDKLVRISITSGELERVSDTTVDTLTARDGWIASANPTHVYVLGIESSSPDPQALS